MHIQTYTCLACKVLASSQLTHVVVWPWQVRRTSDSWSCGSWGPPIDGWGRFGKRKDTGGFPQLIKSRHPRFWMFLDSSFFCYFARDTLWKSIPFLRVPPVVRPSGANHMWVIPPKSIKMPGIFRICDGNSDLDLHLPLRNFCPLHQASSKKHQRLRWRIPWMPRPGSGDTTAKPPKNI